MPVMDIRSYQNTDRAAVWNLHMTVIQAVGAVATDEAWDHDLHTIEDTYLNPGGVFLVGVVDAHIIAMGALDVRTPHRAEVKRMRVHPQYQQHGFGAQMLQALESHARQLGFERVCLETLRQFGPAQRFYTHNGYTEVGCAQNMGEDVILFEKGLYDINVQGTNSLHVRSAALHHAAALAQLVCRNRTHLHAFLPNVVATITSTTTAQAHIEQCQERARTRELFEAHVFYTDTLCGVVRLTNHERENRNIALAYFLDAAYQGKGIMTQAARIMLEYGFNILGCNRIEIRCAVTNSPSRRLAERLGFTREGELRQAEFLNGTFVNHVVYGLLVTEYKAAQQVVDTHRPH